MGADDAVAALLEELHRAGQDVVVAADDDRQDVLEAAHRREIECDALEVGTGPDAADQHEVTATMLQDRIETAELTPSRATRAGKRQCRIGLALDADDQDWPAGGDRGRGDVGWHRSAAGNDRQGLARPLRQFDALGRPLAPRRAERPVAALLDELDDGHHGGMSPNRSATASSRSARVPLPLKIAR